MPAFRPWPQPVIEAQPSCFTKEVSSDGDHPDDLTTILQLGIQVLSKLIIWPLQV